MKLLSFMYLFVFLSGCLADKKDQPIVRNKTVQIAYIKEGRQDTSIVFVHGWGINKQYWNNQLNHLNKRYTVVAIDLGGHGESGHNRNSWTINNFADDVITVIDSLRLNKVILVGHSMGGDIILDVATKIPSKIVGFIGIDNFKDVGVRLTEEQQKQISLFMDALHKNYKATAMAYSKGSLFPPDYKDTISVNRVINDIGNTDSIVAIKALESLIEFSPKEKDMLLQLQVPVHLIVSDFTPTLEDSLAKYCKAGYYVKVISKTGHYPMIEKPGEFNLLVDETLSDISKRK